MPSEASLANLKPAWSPGQSGHSVGAARGYRRVLASARKASPEAMETAIACMRDTNASWRERMAAVAMILDRAWGRPKEHIDLSGADGANIVIVTGVPRNEDVADATIAAEERFTITYDAGDEEDTTP